MNFTNNQNIPFPVFLGLTFREYDNGGVWRSVTELISPAQAALLKRQYDEKIFVDVQDRAYTIQGEAAHLIVERAIKSYHQRYGHSKGWTSEERIFDEILGKKISGAYDLYHEESGYLIDLKNSSAYKARPNDEKSRKDWIAQTNILAHLLRKKGRPVKKIDIVLICRDFSEAKKKEALKKAKEFNSVPDYPEYPINTISLPVWDDKECERYLLERVRAHLDCENKLVECTPDERWAYGDVWAVKKIGTKRAVNNGSFASESAAKELLNKLGKLYEIEFRPAENKRCDKYCSAKDFCPQYKKLLTHNVN